MVVDGVSGRGGGGGGGGGERISGRLLLRRMCFVQNSHEHNYMYMQPTIFLVPETHAAFAKQAGDGRTSLSQVEARTALFSLKLNPTSFEVAKFWADNQLPGR